MLSGFGCVEWLAAKNFWRPGRNFFLDSPFIELRFRAARHIAVANRRAFGGSASTLSFLLLPVPHFQR